MTTHTTDVRSTEFNFNSPVHQSAAFPFVRSPIAPRPQYDFQPKSIACHISLFIPTFEYENESDRAKLLYRRPVENFSSPHLMLPSHCDFSKPTDCPSVTSLDCDTFSLSDSDESSQGPDSDLFMDIDMPGDETYNPVALRPRPCFFTFS
jgi:hypothetical protein